MSVVKREDWSNAVNVRQFARCMSLIMVVLSLLTGPMSTGPVEARSAADDAAEAAVELSELESRGRASSLYRHLHSEAKEIVPESAVVGWYENDFFPLEPQPISEIVSVMFVDWTWGVTGETYRHTAEVSYVQPFGSGANVTYQRETVRLVEEGGEWKWFFGRSLEFVNEQIARFPGGVRPESTETGQQTPIGSTSQSASSSQYTMAVTCSQVDAVVGGVVYAYCDWPFMYSAPFYCIPAVASVGSGGATFLCNTTFTKDIDNPDEVMLDYAPKRFYTIEVTCDVSLQPGVNYERCNWPMFTPSNPECIVDESRLTMPYEKFLICKP